MVLSVSFHLHGSYYRVHPVMYYRGGITWLLVLQLAAQQALSYFCCLLLLRAVELLQCNTWYLICYMTIKLWAMPLVYPVLLWHMPL